MKKLVFLAIFCLLANAAIATADTLYSVVNLGGIRPDTGNGYGTYATALNDLGHVVGVATASDNSSHPFFYSDGTLTSLDPSNLGGDAYGINNSDQVVGWLGGLAFLESGGTISTLPTLGGAWSVAQSINDSGVIVGYSAIDSVRYDAFAYSGGVMTDIENRNDPADANADLWDSVANVINDSGVVVGKSGGNNTNPFYAYRGTPDLGGRFGAPGSESLAINNSGEIAGYYNTGSSQVAFLLNGATITFLGTMPGFTSSVGRGINDAGDVVGSLVGNGYGAFLDSNGIMVNLDSVVDPNLGIHFDNATDINNLGQIIAISGNNSYLLTPLSETVATPEPVLFLPSLLIIACILLARNRRVAA